MLQTISLHTHKVHGEGWWFILKNGLNTKVVYFVSAPVSVWPLEQDISVPVNTGVPFRVYRKYIYIYILIYSSIHLFIKIYNLLIKNLSNYKHISTLILIIIINLHIYILSSYQIHLKKRWTINPILTAKTNRIEKNKLKYSWVKVAARLPATKREKKKEVKIVVDKSHVNQYLGFKKRERKR